MMYICSMADDCDRECYASIYHSPCFAMGEPINDAVECPHDQPPIVARKIVESAFIGYESEVMPKDSGEVQRSECKQAFFGGASIVLAIILSQSAVDLSKTEERAAQDVATLIEELSQELGAFANGLVAKVKDDSKNDA